MRVKKHAQKTPNGGIFFKPNMKGETIFHMKKTHKKSMYGIYSPTFTIKNQPNV